MSNQGLPIPQNVICAEQILAETGLASVEYRDQIDSTNDWAKRVVGSDHRVAAPCLFVANTQTMGRGRNGKSWRSNIGSLAISFLLEREYILDDPYGALTPLAAGLTVCQAIECILGQYDLTNETEPKPQLKWPNDVYVLDRKIAGILVESAGPRQVVIGCGLNVNNSISGLENAISMQQILGRQVPLNQMIILMAQQLLGFLVEQPVRMKDLIEACRRRDWLQGRPIRWTSGSQSITGMAAGIDDHGGLILGRKGTETPVYSGSVKTVEEGK